MASIKIETVQTITSGGISAKITSINPTDSDCLVGSYLTPSLSEKTVRWDLGGRCRDNHDSLNLVMSNDEMKDLSETAILLGAST